MDEVLGGAQGLDSAREGNPKLGYGTRGVSQRVDMAQKRRGPQEEAGPPPQTLCGAPPNI